MCSSKKSPYSPTEEIENSWKRRMSQRPKHLKKCMKLNWNFLRGGGGVLGKKNPSAVV